MVVHGVGVRSKIERETNMMREKKEEAGKGKEMTIFKSGYLLQLTDEYTRLYHKNPTSLYLSVTCIYC
jgi:hypothetical protein